MATETTTNLEQSTIDHLQTLARLNIDSRDGFRYAADKLPDSAGELKSLFQSAAAERDRQASELNRYVELNDEHPRETGSVLASFHRTMMAFRDLFAGTHDPHAILAEAERGEDTIKNAYEVALKETSGSAVNDVLTRQYASVKAMHDRVRNLRDATKKK